MDSNLIEALKWVLGLLVGVVLAVGAYWCKSMASDIKEIKSDTSKHDVLIATITTTLLGRDALQDERWKNLDSKMTLLHTDVQAVVHSLLKGETNKKD